MFSSWRFALALQIPVQLFIFFGQLDHSCRSMKSLWCLTPVAHPCPLAPDPNPSAPQPKPSHWESLPNLGLGTRLPTSAWHVLNTTHISTNKLNTHERPHTDKPRPYPTGPTHLPQPWRCGEKQRKELLRTKARQPPPRNSAAPGIPLPARPRAGGRRPQMRTKGLHGQSPEPERCSKRSPGGPPTRAR